MPKLSYQKFFDKVVAELPKYAPEAYANYPIVTRKCVKDKVTYDGVMFDVPSGVPSPVIYPEQFYPDYENGMSFKNIMEQLGEALSEALAYSPDTQSGAVKELLDGNILPRVYLQVINPETNPEFIGTVPHRDFNDLAIIYRFLVDVDDEGLQSCVITNDILKGIGGGITEDQLFKAALKNTPEFFKPSVKRIEDAIIRMLEKDGAPQELIDMITEARDSVPTDERVYILSNDQEAFGANALLYPERFAEIAKEVGSDLYVLPSSVHEVILVSESYDLDKLKALVKETNEGIVRPEDRLSDTVYNYRRAENDVVVAEPLGIGL